MSEYLPVATLLLTAAVVGFFDYRINKIREQRLDVHAAWFDEHARRIEALSKRMDAHVRRVDMLYGHTSALSQRVEKLEART